MGANKKEGEEYVGGGVQSSVFIRRPHRQVGRLVVVVVVVV